MPTLILHSDGYQSSGLGGTWDGVHDAVGQGNPSTTDLGGATTINAARAEYVSGRNMYYINRSFFRFDTSGITDTLSAATFKIKTKTNRSATPCILVKSGHDHGDSTTDWFSTWLTELGGTLSGWSNSDSEVVAYTDSTALASNNNFTDFTLNASALADIKNNSNFKFVLMNYTHDYEDSAPTGIGRYGVYWVEASSGDRPYIDYTVATAAYGNTVTGVASANIASINGVAVANIDKVNGV